MKYQQFLREAVRAGGLRMTRQRQMILEALEDSQGHLDAEAIHAAVEARGLRIGLATVYRSLDLFVKIGLVREHRLGEEHSHFEMTRETPHYHFTCRRCGRVIEFEVPSVDQSVHELAARHDFEVVAIHLFIDGLCTDCKIKEQTGSPWIS